MPVPGREIIMKIVDLIKYREKLEAARKDEKGFTLAELLIVVAIIAVLIAIAIPVFTSQLEASREATDAANIRSAYAVASAKVLTDGGTTGVAAGPVTLKQAVSGWASGVKDQKIANFKIGDAPSSGDVYVNVGTDGTVSVAASPTSGYTTTDASGASSTTSGTNG